MSVIQTWFGQDLQKAVKVNHIDGNLFSHNGNGNSIGVRVYNDGEPVTLTGTVSGYVITSDGSTVPCVGARSGNEATITIPPAAYQPGNAFITIFLTDGSTVTTLCAAQTTVLQARTGSQVSPGSVVTDWTQTINAAMQSVEDAAENLGGIIATPYASLTYPVPLGKYTYYNSNLYRCISPIETSEEFTAAHWIQVKLGDDVSDLKSAIDNIDKLAIPQLESENPQTASGTGYYLNVPTALDTSKAYRVTITPQTAGTYTIQAGTSANSGSMKDTLLSGYAFAAGETAYVLYRPSVTNIKYFRISASSVEWSISISELLDVSELKQQVDGLGDEVTQFSTDIETVKSDTNTLKGKMDLCLQYKPFDRQLFDCDSMISPRYNFLLKSSNHTVETNDFYRMYVCEINGKSGESFSYNFCEKDGVAVQNFEYATIGFTDTLPANGSSYYQGTSDNTTNMRGSATLNQDSKYALIVVAVTNASSKTQDQINTQSDTLMEHLVLRKGSTYNTTYYDYEKYTDYHVVPYQQGSEYEGKILKVNSSGKLVLADESGGADEARVREIIDDYGVVKDQGSENNGKILAVGNDGLVALFDPEETPTPDVAVRLHLTATMHLGSSILTDAATVLGTGWTGNLTNGFTHTTGNTAELVFENSTENGSPYLVTITSNGATEDALGVGIGDSPLADPYNGQNTMYVGIVADGGYLRIKPVSGFSGTITLKLQKVQATGEEKTISVNNVNCGQTVANISGFWNVALGSDALSANENGSRNVAIGEKSLMRFKSGTRNVCVGTFSMPFVQEGDRNIAIGADTIYGSNSGKKKAYDNVAIGKAALSAGTGSESTIQKNIAIGSSAMGHNGNTAQENIAIGYQAGNYAETGNTHVGNRAGYYNKGNYNTSVGHGAGSDLYNTGNDNVCIGHNSGIKDDNSSASNVATINNAIAIGNGVKAKATNEARFGNSENVIILAGKRIVFNNDNTVTWESIS